MEIEGMDNAISEGCVTVVLKVDGQRDGWNSYIWMGMKTFCVSSQ